MAISTRANRCANVTAWLVYALAYRVGRLRWFMGLIVFADRQGERVRMSLTDQDEENLGHVTPQSFTGSALFEKTFDEGMSLVEETARYLDGRGREESKDLPRKAALLYAGESMRVTTRLMQAASWLLVQRAVHEGEMDAEIAAGDRYRLGSKEICLRARPGRFRICWNAATISIAALRDWTTSCSGAICRKPAFRRRWIASNRHSAR